MRFVEPAVVEELAGAGRLDEALEIYADIVAIAADRNSIGPTEANICRAYLRQAASPESPIASNERLRKAVYVVIFNLRALVDSPVETVWDIVVVYGPLNTLVVTQYLESLPRGVPLKLRRLLKVRAESGNDSMTPALQAALSVVFHAPRYATELSEPLFTQSLRHLRGKPMAQYLLSLCAIYAPEGPLATLRGLFPQLSVAQAQALLKTSHSVEDATQQLLDGPTILENGIVPQKPAQTQRKTRYVPLPNKDQRSANRTPTNQLSEKTLELVLAAQEDEDPDDTLEQPFETLSSADQKLWHQESVLYQAWRKDSALFDRQNRKSAERKKLRAQLQWTDEQLEGWARTLSSDPRRQRALDWRYTMSITAVGRNSARIEQNSNATPEDSSMFTPSSSVESTPEPEGEINRSQPQASGNKRNHRKDLRTQQLRDKSRNKKRDQKNSRNGG